MLLITVFARLHLVVPFVSAVMHRGRRGARLARRDAREYREYSRKEQRRQTGCIAGRMPAHLRTGPLDKGVGHAPLGFRVLQPPSRRSLVCPDRCRRAAAPRAASGLGHDPDPARTAALGTACVCAAALRAPTLGAACVCTATLRASTLDSACVYAATLRAPTFDAACVCTATLDSDPARAGCPAAERRPEWRIGQTRRPTTRPPSLDGLGTRRPFLNPRAWASSNGRATPGYRRPQPEHRSATAGNAADDDPRQRRGGPAT